MSRPWIVLAAFLVLSACRQQGGAPEAERSTFTVGSKDFTESILLGEILAQHVEARTGARVVRRLNLGGTFVCDRALRAGDIDAYVEYSGSADAAILKNPPSSDPAAVFERLRRAYAGAGLVWTAPLGFENTFAILVRGETARRSKLGNLSSAVAAARSWRPGFGYEFTARADGYTGLCQAYGLVFAAPPRTMELALTYRALAAGEIDLIAGNSTDGLIDKLDLFQLADDRRYFPPYEAAPVVRREAFARIAGLERALAELGGKLDATRMRRLNYEVDAGGEDPATVARRFLAAAL